MKLLAPLRRSRTESRYNLTDYVQWVTSAGWHRPPVTTSWGSDPAEPIASNFESLVSGALAADAVVWAVERVRLSVFAEARFLWQELRGGRPGDLFGNRDLEILERPFSGGRTWDLLARMILDADFAGNSFVVRIDDELVRLRPDWVQIVLAPRVVRGKQVGWKRVGYAYREGGDGDLVVFLPDEVAHFAPTPDPLASFRGMSWLTPVIREIQADISATKHKLKFFENAATPNLHVGWPVAAPMTPAQFEEFVELLEAGHKGTENAYKTLYTANGADVTVIGTDLKQLDFKVTQGAGETRIAAAGGVHPTVIGLSEGLAGASLNAGNFGIAKRSTGDITLRPLWRAAAGALEDLLPVPPGARLWYDDRDIEFLREDAKDDAEINQIKANTIANLVKEGFTAESAVAAVDTGDVSVLQHTGLMSVQLHPPGTEGDVTAPQG